MVLTASNVSDGIILQVQSLDERRRVYGGIVVSCAFFYSTGSKAVQSPRPDLMLLVNGEGVVQSGVDGQELLDSCT